MGRGMAPGYKHAIDAGITSHISDGNKNSSMTRYSQPALDLLNRNLTSFGYQVRAIYAERLHMVQYQEGEISSGFEKEFLSFFGFFSNTILPPLDYSCSWERRAVDEVKRATKQNYAGLSKEKQAYYKGMYAFILKQ